MRRDTSSVYASQKDLTRVTRIFQKRAFTKTAHDARAGDRCGLFCRAVRGRDPLEIMTDAAHFGQTKPTRPRDGSSLRKRLTAPRTVQGQVTPVSCFRPVMSCYPRAAAVTKRACGRARFLFSSGGLRGSCGRWVVPALPVFFCYLQGARASDRTTLKLLLTKSRLAFAPPYIARKKCDETT